MAAVHTCFVPLARLSSLEVVSHTGRREVEVSECTSLPGRGFLWVLEGVRLLYVLASSWLWALKCVISSLWCEAVMSPPLHSPSHVPLWVTQFSEVFKILLYCRQWATLLC